MTDETLPGDADVAPAASAGAILAQARQAAGLSIEEVALQLKLAPRQVVAIEREDFAALPGRTFIRGFVRNYARLLKLDVAPVLAALPDEPVARPSERPLAAAASRSIGEMPRESRSRPGIARWAIPLVLIAIVAVAAFYEFARPPVPPKSVAAPPAEPAPATAAPAPAPAAATDAATPPGGSSPTTTGSTTELSNPLAGAATAPPAAAPVPAVATETAPPARNLLVLSFRGSSWIEVRDRSGGVVLSLTGAGGTTREVAVTAPGDLVIGNAAVVDATWRGKPVDVAGIAKQNVARIRLD